METVLELLSGPGNPRNSEGSFVALKDGRILYVYTHYNGASWHDHASADLASRRVVMAAVPGATRIAWW